MDEFVERYLSNTMSIPDYTFYGEFNKPRTSMSTGEIIGRGYRSTKIKS